MNKIIEDNMRTIHDLCKNHNVRELYAFGSAITGDFNEKSDIDLLISFKPMDHVEYADNYFSIADAFEQVFGRPVDLLTEKSLSNPYFIKSVNASKVRLYG